MSNILLQEVEITDRVEILGHTFNGLDDIKKAVETYCRIHSTPWGSRSTANGPIEGIHVICVYEPYPRFDSEDYASENRDYSNYFFSTEPFTNEQIARLAQLPARVNSRIVGEDMPEWAAPAVYYGGEGAKMTVAK